MRGYHRPGSSTQTSSPAGNTDASTAATHEGTLEPRVASLKYVLMSRVMLVTHMSPAMVSSDQRYHAVDNSETTRERIPGRTGNVVVLRAIVSPEPVWYVMKVNGI